MYWGYKFETLSLLKKPWGETSREEIESREDDIVDNYAQYCSLCRTGIAGVSMIIAGEVDGGKNSHTTPVQFRPPNNKS